MDNQKELFQWLANYVIIEPTGGEIKRKVSMHGETVTSNQQLTDELHKPITRKFYIRK